jgi:hypothetical protein
MAKLIIKHELPPPTPLEKLADVAQMVLPVVLVVVAIAVAVSLFLSPSSESGKTVAVMPSPAVTTRLPEDYLGEENHLNSMALEFDQLLEQSREDRDKHQQLVNKAEDILAQLADMDNLVAGMALPDADKQVLQSRHQYQKDYWESKLVFHRLRMARFNINEVPHGVVPDVAKEPASAEPQSGQAITATPEMPAPADNTAPAVANTQEKAVPADQSEAAKAAAAAGPPPGVKLPEGFCPLFGPGAAECKANAKKKP